MKMLFVPIAAALAVAAPAAASDPLQGRSAEARIPFVSFRTIRTFRPVGDDVVYIQDQRRNWYRATLNGPCFNLAQALRIGVDTRYGNTLDNSSSFIVGGETCPIHSLVRSEAPPPRRGSRR